MLVFSLLAAFIVGILTQQSGWYEQPLQWGWAVLRDPRALLTTWRTRAALPTVTLDVRFDDYQQLSELHNRARQLGVHVPFAEETVVATAIFGAGTRESVDVRLLGGPMLSGEAWPLEVRRADATSWLRLTPLDETRTTSAWQQWGYLEALRREGFAAAAQTPVHLEINGSPWGRYILETPAPVDVAVRFDAQAAWEAAAAGEPRASGNFRYARATVTADSPALADTARVRFQDVQWGEAPLSEMCDAKALGRFLALTALWTGKPAPDWRALRWSYDPATQQFAPVGGGQPWPDPAPLPEAFLDDPDVQAAYARALAELSSPAYLEQLRQEHGAALEAYWQALGATAVAMPWARLEAHQRAMRARLAPEHPLTASLERDGAAFVLHIANLHPFPIHIEGLDAGAAGVRTLDPAWALAEDRGHLMDAEDAFVLRAATGAAPHPVRVALPRHLTTAGEEGLAIVCRLWGTNGPPLRAPVIDPEVAP